MKTIYNVKTLCVVALLGTAATVNAQEDTSKKQNLDREMTLEREYDPSVQDASKVNTLPVIKEPTVKKMPIDYANFTVPADPAKEISLLASGSIMTDIQYNKRRGYFNFGAGTYLNLNGDLGYHILSTDKDQLNIWFSHRSTNGKVKYLQIDEKVKAKLNDNMGGLNFKHVFPRAFLDMGIKYGYSAFNYYGLPVNGASALPTEELLEKADRTTSQVDQTIQGKIGVGSVDGAPFGYYIGVDYTNFSYKYGLGIDNDGPTEHTVRLNFDFNAPFNGNQKIGLAGRVEYFNYSSPDDKKIAPGIITPGKFYSYDLDNYTSAVLNPYYKIEGDSWNVKLGAKVMIVAGLDDDSGNTFTASPDIAADVEVAEKTVLYAVAGGDLHSNSMYDISRINRYADPSESVNPSREWLDAKLGIKSGIAPGFWFDIFGGYKIISDDYFFNTYNNFYENDFGNICTIRDGIDTKQLYVGANLKYSFQQLVDIQLKGVYNNWKMELGDDYIPGGKIDPIGKPKMELNAGVTVRPIKNLSASLDYYLATGRKAEVYGITQDMDNINELNLTGAYNFNDTFGLYLKLNNVLFQKYELYYGYPLQKFSAMIGVNINF